MLAPNTFVYTAQAHPSTAKAAAVPPKKFRGLAFRDEFPRGRIAKSLNGPVLLRIRLTPQQFHVDPFQAGSCVARQAPLVTHSSEPFAEVRSIIKASFS